MRDTAARHGSEPASETRNEGASPLSFDARIVASGLIGDPYFEGVPRFREEPVVLSAASYAAMCRAAEGIVAAHDEAVRMIEKDETLLDSFFELMPCQKLAFLASAPFWHGYARADVFDTKDGLKICELNSDTPTGHAEATCLSSLVRDDSGRTWDPNVGLAEAHVHMFEAYLATRVEPGAPKTAGILYPTDLTEDLPWVRLIQGWLEARGFRVSTGAPQNLTLGDDGRARLLGVPCSLVVRHYKTDWWTERVPVWQGDPPFDDPLPLAGPLEVLVRAEVAKKTVVVNPFGAILSQNKRMLAFLWEHLARFSEQAQKAIVDHLPETLRLESLHPAMLSVEREAWVLKSDYGCEGDEVVLGCDLSQAEWDRAISLAQRGRFVAQRRFSPRLGPNDESINHGVYVVAGKAAGLYARTHRGTTDRASTSAPVWVKK